MGFDRRQCDALCAVLDTGSFEQAALRLNLTASAISQRVRALEESLGKSLVVRGRPCHATPAGQRLLTYLRRARLLEQDLQAEFAGDAAEPLQVAVAVNADSLASWLLPAVAPFVIDEGILLDLIVDDQDHTHALLEAGQAIGCVSTAEKAMRGCVAEPLGTMRYRAMAAPAFRQRWFARGMTRAAARRAPVMAYNRKDKLQEEYLLRHFGLPPGSYPCHYLPASDPYLRAIALGIGWGMLPEVQMGDLERRGMLVDLMPAHPHDVALWWHRWKVQSPRLERLSKALAGAARTALLPG